MMRRTIVALAALIAVAAGLGAGLTPAYAASGAKVYVIHGIPGRDLGLQPSLPVDVSVNGACALTRFKFGQSVGPLELPAGTYDIKISLADSANPCGGPTAIQAPVPFSDGESATVIAHLSEAGAPTASKFVNDVSPAGEGLGRVVARHTAAAPTVDVLIKEFNRSTPIAVLPDLSNGEQTAGELPVNKRVRVQLAPAGTTTPVAFGSAKARPDETVIYHAVGSLRKGTFTFIELRVEQ